MRPPGALPPVPSAPEVGRLLWLCRPGFEAALYEELAWFGSRPKPIGPGVVESGRLPQNAEPAFARAGFQVGAVFRGFSAPEDAAAWLASTARDKRVHLRGFSPDSDEGNRFATLAADAGEQAAHRVPEAMRLGTPWQAFELDGLLGELCLLLPDLAAVGLHPARSAHSLAAGGKQRMRRGEEAPSRAASKLLEAFDLSSLVPGKGDLCADLGAAPGGWTQVLVHKGARVVAVDPANLAPELAHHRLVRHEKASAFQFEPDPDEPFDFLLCDMVWRPLEVAQMLAKWARRGWATALIANLKLPMKDKLPVVYRCREILEAGGWKGIRIRQLYHDRDEVTVVARLRG